MAQFPRAPGVHGHPRFVQHLAIQKTTQLGPAQEIMCKAADICRARLQPCREKRSINAALLAAEKMSCFVILSEAKNLSSIQA